MKELSRLINTPLSCTCGRVHEVPVRSLSLHADMDAVAEACLTYIQGRNLLVVSDLTTYELQARELIGRLEQKGFKAGSCLYTEAKVLPDERSLGQLMMSSAGKPDGLIAVGSGTITDLTRMAAARQGIPFLSVPTAPSMDGYASGVSSLLAGGRKTTYPGVTASAILGDIGLIAAAPLKLLQAGFGDIIGKKISVCDWLLGHTLNGEYLCPYTLGLVEQAADSVIARAEGIRSREPEAVQGLMEALLLSGMAIAMAGDSRPASGSEHLLAHYLEGAFLREDREPLSHGLAVAVGTLCAGMFYHTVLNSAEWVDKEQITAVREALGARQPVPWQIRSWLENIGLSASPGDYGISRELLREALLLSHFTRPRYTIFSFAAKLGILEQAAERVLDKLYPL